VGSGGYWCGLNRSCERQRSFREPTALAAGFDFSKFSGACPTLARSAHPAIAPDMPYLSKRGVTEKWMTLTLHKLLRKTDCQSVYCLAKYRFPPRGQTSRIVRSSDLRLLSGSLGISGTDWQSVLHSYATAGMTKRWALEMDLSSMCFCHDSAFLCSGGRRWGESDLQSRYLKTAGEGLVWHGLLVDRGKRRESGQPGSG
jgi:hypothetical protein